MESYMEEHIEGLENLSINCQVRESEMSFTVSPERKHPAGSSINSAICEDFSKF